jgi:hypothetical protein
VHILAGGIRLLSSEQALLLLPSQISCFPGHLYLFVPQRFKAEVEIERKDRGAV